MTVRFACVTPIAAAPERVFDLALDIDEHLGSMARFRERATAGVTSGHIAIDEEVTWHARHFGIPFTMTSRIVELRPPTRFVDEQVRGPFRCFHHEHRFESAAVEGTRHGTRMIDTISFDAPFGRLGRVVETAVLGRYLRELIAVRNEHLKATAEARAMSRERGEVVR